MEVTMKRFCALVITAIFVLSLSVSPVFAAGGKNHGSVGQGTTDQGSTGSDTGYALGDNAQDNQAD